MTSFIFSIETLIKPALYHPLFIWINANNCNKEILEGSRQNILRYLIYCFFTVEKHDKASKLAIETLKEKEFTYFPDKIIYDNLLDEELVVQIPTPAEFAKPFEVAVDGFLRHRDDIFNITDDAFNSFRTWFCNDSKDILLWFQRGYLYQLAV